MNKSQKIKTTAGLLTVLGGGALAYKKYKNNEKLKSIFDYKLDTEVMDLYSNVYLEHVLFTYGNMDIETYFSFMDPIIECVSNLYRKLNGKNYWKNNIDIELLQLCFASVIQMTFAHDYIPDDINFFREIFGYNHVKARKMNRLYMEMLNEINWKPCPLDKFNL